MEATQMVLKGVAKCVLGVGFLFLALSWYDGSHDSQIFLLMTALLALTLILEFLGSIFFGERTR
jgi:hypothetical protein